MQIVVSGSSSARIQVSQSGNTVLVQKPTTSIVSVITAGPQGPAFGGQQFFDFPAIEGLSVADSGVTLKWNGVQYTPATELGPNLTINGGAF